MNAFDHYPDPSSVSRIDELRIATAAIVHDPRGRILLQKRADNGHWGLPGGLLEKGESLAAGVAREVLEETGLNVEVERVTGVYSDPAHRMLVRFPEGKVAHYVVITFACRIVGPVREPLASAHDAETDALGWFELGNLPAPLVPSHRLRIADYAQGDAAAAIR